jgi:DNA-directed RNA polymerase alpha subunit
LSKLFTSLNFKSENPEIVAKSIIQTATPTNTKLDLNNTQIEELELSVRAYNCLKRADIQTIGELITYSKEELLEFKNFGQKSADEVCESLTRRFNTNLK